MCAGDWLGLGFELGLVRLVRKESYWCPLNHSRTKFRSIFSLDWFAVDLCPHYAHIYFNRGNLYASLGQYEKADNDYTQGKWNNTSDVIYNILYYTISYFGTPHQKYYAPPYRTHTVSYSIPHHAMPYHTTPIHVITQYITILPSVTR